MQDENDPKNTLGRRTFLKRASAAAAAVGSANALPGSVAKALAIPARCETGTINDVQHVVILMQENRSFDHYFGTMAGVRGFADRTTIPLASGKSVWHQSDGSQDILPFHLDTQATSAMRVPGTPHTWPDAQLAWAQGRFGEWPRFKKFQSMGYYEEDDIPFQRALARAFTLCDAHHCSVQTGTLPNRVVFMTGTNATPGMTEPATSQAQALIDNANNRGANFGLYNWTTYPERLEQAGVSWRIYQDPADNWTALLAPWESFEQYKNAQPGDPLFEKAMRLWTLDDLAADVANGTLPQVSWIIPSPVWSEHPSASSPLQGASYTQQVLDILIQNPALWSKTVFIVTFDENDGFFDHVPPPAAPSYLVWDADETKRVLAGGSTVDTLGEYHENVPWDVPAERAEPLHRPYGLGPRVPAYVISPWSRGGWVNSEVFDHTSVIRFLEQRFGVMEPNISAWRRAVAGDLTSAFNFADPDDSEFYYELPETLELAERAAALPGRTTPPTPELPELPVQAWGIRPSRALPYELHTQAKERAEEGKVSLLFANTGRAGAVFHVYDRRHLERIPRRYTVGSGHEIGGDWDVSADGGRYDLWVLGPNGFHRHFSGELVAAHRHHAPRPEIRVDYDPRRQALRLVLSNRGDGACPFRLSSNAYQHRFEPRLFRVPARGDREALLPLKHSASWYDFTVEVEGLAAFSRRFAGRMETGRHSLSDPEMGGRARGERG
jgi:phospholipase C